MQVTRDDQGRIVLPKIEFYITNVCNLACPNCNRFNDHDFKGWQRWQDYEEQYTQWSKLVKLEQAVIIGGEPLLNPSLIDWVKGINRLWDIPVQILSNGLRINHVRGLYDLLRTGTPSDPTMLNWLGISWHDPDTIDELDQEIRKFMPGMVKRNDNDKYFNAHAVWTDRNFVSIPAWMQDKFQNSAVIKKPEGGFTVHDTDPEHAHSICAFVRNKNYHFIKGAIYKCGPSALLPEFDDQHHLDISEADRQLMHSYKPLTLDTFESGSEDFFAQLDNPIPQCKFCPNDSTTRQIRAQNKKGRTIMLNTKNQNI